MDQSPLNDLPAELRNEIYSYALDIPEEIRIELPYWDLYILHRGLLRNAFALISTCRQIHEESLPLLLSYTKFVFPCGISERSDRATDDDLLTQIGDEIHQWVQIFGKHSKHLKNVMITPCSWYTWCEKDDYLCDFYPTAFKRLQDVFKDTRARVGLLIPISPDEKDLGPRLEIPVKDKRQAQEAVDTAQKELNQSIEKLSSNLGSTAPAVQQVRRSKETLQRFLSSLQSS